MKKLTNMLRLKERKKRKDRHAKLNRGRWRRFIYIKDKGEKNSRKSKQRINVEKIIGLKIKIKKKKKKPPQNYKSPI